MNTKPVFPSDAADKVLVRMPDGMRDQLKTAAKANNRTMNAEIVARLEQSLAPADSALDTAASLRADFRKLRERVDAVLSSARNSGG